MSETDNGNSKSRVTHIAVKRVHNLGNYENIQYEVGVEVGEKDDPGKVLGTLETILNDVQAKSPVESYQLRSARNALAKPEAEMSKDEKERLPYHRELIEKHEAALKRREAAKVALATLNCTEVRHDAKENWDDGDYDQYQE